MPDTAAPQGQADGTPTWPSIAVAVMAYNEVGSLERVVRELLDELQRMGAEHECIIIDDGSTDGTSELADAIAKDGAEVRVVHHPTNLGLGAVYREAFYCGNKELTTIFPADGQFESSIIPQFARRFDEADMVLGCIPEYHKNRSLVARFFSWGERLLYKILFGGFPDFQGIMMFRRSLVDTVPLKSAGRGWMIQMELILRFQKKGYRIVGEPTGIRARMTGNSKVVNLRSILSNLRQVFVLRGWLWGSNSI